MGQNLDCETVRDLFPTYIEKITSEISNESIEEHLEGCEECRIILEQMSRRIEVETTPEVQNFKKYLNRSKKKFALTAIEILSAIAIITCCIVNLAVDRGLTWSLIVDGSIVSLLLVIYTGFCTTNHRFIKMTAVTNLCTILLLGLIQIVLHPIMGITGLWFFNIGLPITLIWSVAVWLAIACYMFLKTNLFITLSLFFFLSLFSITATNIISGGYDSISGYFYNFIGNELGCLLLALALLAAGIRFRRKKKA